MDVEGKPKLYGDRTILEPFFKQQDHEMKSSPMSNSYREGNLIENERRIREEIQQFEALEKEFRSREYIQPITHTTMIERESYFRMNEDGKQVIKHFYHNEFSSENKENKRSDKIIPIETTNEPDYTEEEYTITFQEGDLLYQTNEEMYPNITGQSDQISFSSPGKSILKKPSKEQTMSTYSLSPSQLQEEPTVRYTFLDKEKPVSYGKQHVAWSPSRNSIQQRRDPIPKPSMENSKIKESFFANNSNLYVSPAPMVEEKKIFFSSPFPEIIYVPPQNKEHSETIQSDDHLSERKRKTDEQIPSRSQPWTNSAQQRTTIKDTKPLKSKELISPMFLQTCLLTLIIFNLLVVYFFNDINILWSWFVSYSAASHHQDDDKLSYW